MKKYLKDSAVALIMASFMLSMVMPVSAYQLAFAWNSSPDADLAGYRMHWGTSPGQYDVAFDVGNVTTVGYEGFVPGITYYFVVTALNSVGLESDPSNELSVSRANTDPTITPIADQTIVVNGWTGVIPFQVGDAESLATELSVVAVIGTVIGDSDLVSQTGIIFAGSDGNRTIQIVPNAGKAGACQITVVVSDGVAISSTTFTLTVNTLDSTYAASPEFTVNRSSGLISGAVSAPPSDPKLVYWSKGELSVTNGQILTLSGNMYFGGAPGEIAPVSVFLTDAVSGNWISPERVIFINSSYDQYQTELIVKSNCANACLVIVCGLKVGSYEFQQTTINLTNPPIAPITRLYLEQLLPKMTNGLYSIVERWNPVPGSQGYKVRMYTTRRESEKGAAGIMWTNLTLAPTQTTVRVDIPTNLYSGFYVVASSSVGGVESTPWYTWYLPGQTTNHADQAIPPVCLQAAVSDSDTNFVCLGYTLLYKVPALINDREAGPEERSDIDNNGQAGRITDKNFILGQRAQGRHMQ